MRALVVTTVAIFLADIVAMGVIAVAGLPSFVATVLVDASIMVVLAFPVLYVFVFRPMMRLLAAHHAVEQELGARNEQLTAEIRDHERAREDLRRFAAEQAALYAVTAAATHRLDVDELAAEAAEVVIRLFGADAGWVLVPGGVSAGALRVAFAQRAPETLLAAAACEPAASCDTCGPWFTHGLPRGEDAIVTSCPRLPRDLLASVGLASHVGVMLRVGTRVLGSLNLAWSDPRVLSQAERSFLVTVAGQIGLAIDNALLFGAEKRARQTAETIGTASLAVTRTLDLEDVLRTLLGHLRLLVPYDRARVMLLDGASRLRVRAVFENGTAAIVEDGELTFDASANPVVGSVLTTMRGVLIGDLHRHPEWGHRMRPDYQHSWMGVPLVAGGAAIGLYSLAKAEPDGFTPEDLRLAEALSAAASVAIHNATLFKQVVAGRERQRTLSRRLVELQEEERRRVSRELHDGAGQALTSLVLGLRLLRREAEAGAPLGARAGELEAVVEGVQESLHRIASGLRPAALDHLGLVPALKQLAEEMATPGGPHVVFEAVGISGERLSPDVETALYRVAQEALSNACLHAAAGEVAVVLERRGGRLRLVVEDDGKGIDRARAPSLGRLGMMGMRERAEMLGGSFIVESGRGAGTTIVVEVPDGH